ncbi:MAG: transporter, partial [Myxococcota bacterium]
MTLWYGGPNTKGGLAIEGLFDFADAPLLRWTPDPNTPDRAIGTPFLDDVLTLRLGARYGVSKRFGVAASVPFVLTHSINSPQRVGPTFGDIQLSAPIWLLTAGSTHVSVVPTARLPTGNASRYLGDDGAGGSVIAVVSTSAGPIAATANLGLNYRTFEQESNVQPGPGLVGGASVGAVVREGLGLHLEGRFHQRLIGQEAPLAPEFYDRAVGGAEVMLSGRGRLSSGTFVSAGVGTGVVGGFAAARYRALLGIGHTFGGSGADRVAKAPKEPKTPKVREPKVVEPVDLPVVVRVHDESGVPIQGMVTASEGTKARLVDGQAVLDLPPGDWTVDVEADGFGSQARDLSLAPAQRSGEQVEFILLPQSGNATLNMDLVSPEGDAVDDARVSLNGRPVGTSGSGGGVVVRGLADKPVEVQVQAEAFRERTAANIAPSDADAPVELLLARQRGAVQVQVVDGNNQPIPGVRARFLGPDRLGPYTLGDLGSRTFVLRPGDWQALVSHPDYGIQQRGVHVKDQDTELTRVQVVLQPPEEGSADLLLRVVDRDNRDVPGAKVELGGVPYGATSSGGQMRLPNLQPGPRTVRISGDNVLETTADVLLHNGIQEQLIVVDWRAGSTLVRARGPAGMAPDAAARFQGPELIDVLPLGPDGVEVLRLNAGVWQVLVSSPSLGMAQQGIDVMAAAHGLSIVDVLLGTTEERGKTLFVEVLDPGGEPVEGANIALDSTSRGTTASLGTLAISNIDGGKGLLDVSASPFASQQRPVRLTEDEQNERFALEWGIGAVRVRARSGTEWVTDAVVRLGGPRFIPATPVDPDGQRLFGLEPG